ncbi:MAG: hypothetical protein RTV72_01985 [Candidatus Thorarchaeota archaeon]
MKESKMSTSDACLVQISVIWLAIGFISVLPAFFFSFMGLNIILLAIGLGPPILMLYKVYSNKQKREGISRGTRAREVVSGFVIPPLTPPHRIRPLRENELL